MTDIYPNTCANCGGTEGLEYWGEGIWEHAQKRHCINVLKARAERAEAEAADARNDLDICDAQRRRAEAAYREFWN